MPSFPPSQASIVPSRAATTSGSTTTTTTTTTVIGANIVVAGSLGATYTLDLSAGANPYETIFTGTLTADLVLTIIGVAVGSQAVLEFTQDGTGSRALTINGTAVGILPDANSVSRVTLTSPDGAKLIPQGPSLLGRKYLITATNATWPIPAGATALEVVCVGGGGQGGGGGTNAGAAANAGGGGGGAGPTTTSVVQVGANTTLNVTVGAGGSAAGGGGAAGGNVGVTGSQGGQTSVTGTGISVTAFGGSGGAGGPASATTAAQGGTTPNGNGNPVTAAAAIPGSGGASGPGPVSGYIGLGYQGSGGGGGGPSSTTLGGAGGNAGSQGAGGVAGITFTGTSAGGSGTAGTANSAGGGGGGGGAPSGGIGGAGGAGGSGYALATVTALTGAALPIPVPGGVAGPDIWDARIAPADQVVYFTNPNTTNSLLVGVSPNDAKLTNYAATGGGMTNPLNGTAANNRVWGVAPFGTIAARPQKVMRLRCWSTDTNNKNNGQQLHPACGASSPFDLSSNGTGNWKSYFGISVYLPNGVAGAAGQPSGDDKPFPTNIQGFYQCWEPFGFGFGQPFASLKVAAGGFVHGGTPTRPDLIGSSNNYFVFDTGAGAIWVDANPVVYNTWYDFVFYIQRATAANTTGIVGDPGGLGQVFMNGVQQVLLPGSTQGGYSGAVWTITADTKTYMMDTMNTGGGTGYNNIVQYRTITSPNEPITAYCYPVGAGSTFARVDPSTH